MNDRGEKMYWGFLSERFYLDKANVTFNASMLHL